MNWASILPDRSGALYAGAVRTAESVLERLADDAPRPTFDPRSDGTITLRWGAVTIDCDASDTVAVAHKMPGQVFRHVVQTRVADLDLGEMLR